MTAYYLAAAYRSAVAHPYHVRLYRDWSDAPPVVVGFRSEADARAFAAARPEPIVDLVRHGAGVIARRRLLEHPVARLAFVAIDDFPEVRP